MFGAVIGDTIGSIYEFDNLKSKDFPLFGQKSSFTDDSVCTVAIGMALVESLDYPPFESVLQKTCRSHLDRGYGGMFSAWMWRDPPKPYGSFGNGSAMRTSACAWVTNDLECALSLAADQASVTHNHPDGIRGAQAVTAAIHLFRMNASVDEVRACISSRFNYDLARSSDQIRPTYGFVETCNGSVPEALICALEGISFEDTIRTAISIGGDSDTIAAIAGGVAEARFEIPDEIAKVVFRCLGAETRTLQDGIRDFYRMYRGGFPQDWDSTEELMRVQRWNDRLAAFAEMDAQEEAAPKASWLKRLFGRR